MAYRLGTQNLKKGICLTIEKKYWDKEKKRPRTKHCQSLGYLHDLQKQYPDPAAHFKEVISQMNAEEKGTDKLTSVSIIKILGLFPATLYAINKSLHTKNEYVIILTGITLRRRIECLEGLNWLILQVQSLILKKFYFLLQG